MSDHDSPLEKALSREKQIMMSLEIAHKTIRSMERANSKMRAALKRIMGACGMPDSGQACRAIYNLAKEALTE